MPWPALMETASKLSSRDLGKLSGICLNSSLLGNAPSLDRGRITDRLDAMPCKIATRSPMRIYLFVLGLSLPMPTCRYGFQNPGSVALKWNRVSLRTKCVRPTTWVVGSSPATQQPRYLPNSVDSRVKKCVTSCGAETPIRSESTAKRLIGHETFR